MRTPKAARAKTKKRPVKRAKPKKPSEGRVRMALERTFLYVLVSCNNPTRSYVGVTNDIGRRLRKHNGFVSGGARYTSMFKPWRVHAMFRLNNRHDALSLEWKVKHRKRKTDGLGVEGRLNASVRLGADITGFVRCF